jgi:hypothetical protein
MAKLEVRPRVEIAREATRQPGAAEDESGSRDDPGHDRGSRIVKYPDGEGLLAQ